MKVSAMDPQPRKYGSLKLYGRLLLEARPYWPHVLGFMLLSLLATPLALLLPLPLKIAVDSVIGSRSLPHFVQMVLPNSAVESPTAILLFLAALMVIFALLTLIHQLAVAMLKTYVGEQVLIAFRSRLFRHVQRLSLSYHDRKGTSDSTYRIQYDAPAIQNIVIDTMVPMISAVVMLGGMIYVTARLSPRLALVAVAVCPPLLLITGFVRCRLRRQWRQVKNLESSAQSIVQEVLGAVRVVKAFTRESHEHERFEKQSRSGMSARMWAAFQEHCYAAVIGLIVATGTAAVLFVGVLDVRSGSLSLGNLLMVMAYVGKLYDPVKTLGKQLGARERSLASAERAFALLDEAPEVPERPDARPLVRAVGAVEFRDVCFGYDGGSPVLEHISIDISPGTRVGIAGKTGAGKTTLINLLCRFYDLTAGQILVDQIDLRDYRLADLRNQFAVVLQEPVLFSTTVAENIAYGRPGASHEQVLAASKAANAHEFIEALPDGYQTQVGERGMCLSGGERQRISLARAFLKDAPILVLDEPTSSVDLKTEAQIMEAMQRLMRGRTSFLIAHRPGTLAGCDLLLRIENGRLVHSAHAPITQGEPRDDRGRFATIA
jgi:ATP-binding cassette subfamily B protein